MNILSDFTDFIYETNTPGSNKAGSYVRALKYLNVMLRECSPEWKDLGDVFEVDSIDTLKKLHRLTLVEAAKGSSSHLAQANVPPSYLEGRFCAGALRALIGYRLALAQDAEMADTLAGATDPSVVAKTIEQTPLPEPEFFLDGNVNPKSKEGKAALNRNLAVRNRTWRCATGGSSRDLSFPISTTHAVSRGWTCPPRCGPVSSCRKTGRRRSPPTTRFAFPRPTPPRSRNISFPLMRTTA